MSAKSLTRKLGRNPNRSSRRALLLGKQAPSP
jgi:hypothetical protein